MDKDIEEKFVKCYIAKNKRERLIFELQGEKRRHGIGRFCHSADDLLITSKIKISGKYIIQDLKKKLEMAKDDKCYVISYYENLDGRIFNKNEVLDVILGMGMPSIAIFDDFAIIETEQECGPAMKYLLQK